MANQDGKSSSGNLTKKLLMPVVATAVSAAATYAGKKAPELIGDKLMPKLRDAGSGTEDLVSGLTERAKSAVPGLGGDGDGGGSDSGSSRRLSSSQYEDRRREREQHRSERRKASRRSAS
jgi:hypothetical protein